MRKAAIITAILVTILVGAAVCAIGMISIQGDHSPFRAQNSLRRMHEWVKFSMKDGAPLPNEIIYNRQIQEAWESALRGEHYEPPEDFQNDDSYWALQSMKDDFRHFTWGRPPVYVVSEKLRDGFGLYLEGEDGESRSQGRDKDDINSWDGRSHLFYSQRQRKQTVTNSIIAGCLSGLVGGAVVLAFAASWGAFKPRQEAQ